MFDPAARFVFVTVPYVITGTLMLVAIAINFANVIARYVFDAAIFWTEEVLGFLMIYSVFIAAVTIAFNGDNINMDLFYSKFSSATKRAVNLFVFIVFVASCIFVVVQAYKVFALHLRNGSRSVAAGIPTALPQSALVIGFSLMALAICYRWRMYLNPSRSKDTQTTPPE